MIKIKFLRFLIVGGINTLFGYLVFSFFLYINFHYSLATLLATICGVLFNFITIGKLVFNNNDNSLFFKFIGVYVIIYFLNVFFLKMFELFNVNLYLAAALLILPMAMVSFTINRKFVFKNGQGELLS